MKGILQLDKNIVSNLTKHPTRTRDNPTLNETQCRIRLRKMVIYFSVIKVFSMAFYDLTPYLNLTISSIIKSLNEVVDNFKFLESIEDNKCCMDGNICLKMTYLENMLPIPSLWVAVASYLQIQGTLCPEDKLTGQKK